MKKRHFLFQTALLGAMLFGTTPLTATSAATMETPASLRGVRYPVSLDKVCDELSRRYAARATADPSLQAIRVTWAFNTDVPLKTTMDRLAELTGGNAVVRVSKDKNRRYALERDRKVTELEARCRIERLHRFVRELIRAADAAEQGRLKPEEFSEGIRIYLNLGRASEMKYLRLLTPEQLARLLSGEKIHFPPDLVPDAEYQQIIANRFRDRPGPDEDVATVQRFQMQELEELQKHGLALELDRTRMGSSMHLLLRFGRKQLGTVLARLGDEELGLPLTRTNPYRLLESGPPPEAATLPSSFRKRLPQSLTLPAGGRWEAVLQELARRTGIDMISDAYLCRSQSVSHTLPGQSAVLIPPGVTVAEALDLICRRYGYLWWEKDGCVFFRSRAWVWDADYEPPDHFLDTWRSALENRRTLGVNELAVLAGLTPLQINGLDNLPGSLFLNQDGPDSGRGREFLRFYARCSPAERLRLLNTGLTVLPQQRARLGEFFLPSREGAEATPVTLRLNYQITTNEMNVPPLTTARLALQRFWNGGSLPIDLFQVDLPRLSDPFVP